jgi:hypothetical protein
MRHTSTPATIDPAMDLLRRLVEWHDRGDCRSLGEFAQEARALLAACGVRVLRSCQATRPECPHACTKADCDALAAGVEGRTK